MGREMVSQDKLTKKNAKLCLFGKKGQCDNDSSTYKMNYATLVKVDKFTDLGVLFD